MKNSDQLFWAIVIVIGIWAAVTPGRQIEIKKRYENMTLFAWILARVYFAYLVMKQKGTF
jgi:hypothetical protein